MGKRWFIFLVVLAFLISGCSSASAVPAASEFKIFCPLFSRLNFLPLFKHVNWKPDPKLDLYFYFLSIFRNCWWGCHKCCLCTFQVVMVA